MQAGSSVRDCIFPVSAVRASHISTRLHTTWTDTRTRACERAVGLRGSKVLRVRWRTSCKPSAAFPLTCSPRAVAGRLWQLARTPPSLHFFPTTLLSFVMAAGAPAAPIPSADAVSRAAQDAFGISGASDAPSGVAGVHGAGGASGRDMTGGTINAKSSFTIFFFFVRLCIDKLWHDTMHARARRHHSHGVSKRLQVSSISAHLVATDSWVKRL